jgi:hypothetical protein
MDQRIDQPEERRSARSQQKIPHEMRISTAKDPIALELSPSTQRHSSPKEGIHRHRQSPTRPRKDAQPSAGRGRVPKGAAKREKEPATPIS